MSPRGFDLLCMAMAVTCPLLAVAMQARTAAARPYGVWLALTALALGPAVAVLVATREPESAEAYLLTALVGQVPSAVYALYTLFRDGNGDRP